MNRIGNHEWGEISIWDDNYHSEDDDLSPLDDDYVREEYRDDEW